MATFKTAVGEAADEAAVAGRAATSSDAIFLPTADHRIEAHHRETATVDATSTALRRMDATARVSRTVEMTGVAVDVVVDAMAAVATSRAMGADAEEEEAMVATEEETAAAAASVAENKRRSARMENPFATRGARRRRPSAQYRP